jgi:predicted nucleic acid-binding protein
MAAASDASRQDRRFVLDSSTGLAWCFTDEQSAHAHAVLDSLTSHQAVVPGVWPFEVANALLSGERRRRSTADDTRVWLDFLHRLPITVQDVPTPATWHAIVDLARRHRLSAYDAAYLEASLRLSLPLASLDFRLQAAAQAAGVTLYAPRGFGLAQHTHGRRAS